MCLLRAEVANPDLPDALEKLGAIVDDIAIYNTVAETEDSPAPAPVCARKARTGSRSPAARRWNISMRALICRSC